MAVLVGVVLVVLPVVGVWAADRTRPDDPMFEDQWALENTGQMVNWTEGTPGADIDATRAWNLTTGSRSVVVAILDGDFDYAAEDLAANAWVNPGGVNGCPAGTHGYHVPTGACEPYAVASHGTRMGWVMGAVGDNGQGMSGVNWATSLMGVTVKDERDDQTLIEGIDWIVDARQAGVDVRVINASWGWLSGSDEVRDAIARAGRAGILLVAAAGNDGEDNDSRDDYPCNFDLSNVICVAASDQHDELAPGSAYGHRTVDLAAPGRHICASPYSSCGGTTSTSYAAAFVSGAAALVWSYDPGLSVSQVRSAILGNVDRLESLEGKVATGGRLNVYRAITSTDSTSPSPSESDSGSPSPSESDSESPSPTESQSDPESPSTSDSEPSSESPPPSPSESESPSDGDSGEGSDTGSQTDSGSTSTSGSHDSGFTDRRSGDSSSGGSDGDGDGDGGGAEAVGGTSGGTSSGAAGGGSDAGSGAAAAHDGDVRQQSDGPAPVRQSRPSTQDSGLQDPAVGTATGGAPAEPAVAAGHDDDGQTTSGVWWLLALVGIGTAVWLVGPGPGTRR